MVNARPLRDDGRRVLLGLDLGQRRDHSALVIIEKRVVLTGEFDAVHWRHVTRVRMELRHAERLPLGLPYLALAARLRLALEGLNASSYAAAPVTKILVLDAAGPGGPIAELLHRARLGVRLMPITITGGGRPNGSNVPRAVLLARLRILLESGILRLSPRARDLHGELRSVRLDGRQSGHDDLALALALAVWPAGPPFAPPAP